MSPTPSFFKRHRGAVQIGSDIIPAKGCACCEKLEAAEARATAAEQNVADLDADYLKLFDEMNEQSKQLASLSSQHTRLRAQVQEVCAHMEAIEIVAGQCSAEGDESSIATLMAGAEAARLAKWRSLLSQPESEQA